ncbi:MAG: glutathione peroxidase [Bacteroides sp.]|nr:glutathione peroxidase [Bacteroides sp.]
MRSILLGCMLFLVFTFLSGQQKNFHDFTVQTIEGKDFPLAQLKGKKVLVVNVASKCGLTPQYEQLQALYDIYGANNLEILGFPANNFREQEPGTNQEILAFCRNTYDVSFPMMSKISVSGEDMHPLYQWLTQKSENGKEDAPVTWNFQKFLIDENGNWVATVEPGESPFSEVILNWLDN